MPKHPSPAAATGLPETRAALEALIEAVIARLDEMDGDPDLEPTLGSTLSLDLAGTAWPGPSGERADPRVDECEEVSEDEGAACEDEGDTEHDCSYGGEDEASPHFWARPEEQRRTAEACQTVVDALRRVQRRQGKEPVSRLLVVGGAIVR